MEIVIHGQTPAKKNSRQGVVRAGRIMNFPSKKYVEWERGALLELKQFNGQADGKVTIAYQFFVGDNRRRDIDNMIASCNDVLVKAGLIKDDDWKNLAIGGADAELDKENPRVEMWVSED